VSAVDTFKIYNGDRKRKESLSQTEAYGNEGIQEEKTNGFSSVSVMCQRTKRTGQKIVWPLMCSKDIMCLLMSVVY